MRERGYAAGGGEPLLGKRDRFRRPCSVAVVHAVAEDRLRFCCISMRSRSVKQLPRLFGGNKGKLGGRSKSISSSASSPCRRRT